eukprot:TRINITY_DN87693_c0_g1_i1.p1 TRINITY_DN87693_c0_g1~~TRINITY_DN87693_c0_g1_i1.p1  ORF type:complete len:412 (-),score=97.39 TRINITY_DN87693_c0_g1_i1:117-1292(-)
MVAQLLIASSLISSIASAVSSTCDRELNLLQHEIAVDLDHGSDAEISEAVSVPDVVTHATFVDAENGSTNESASAHTASNTSSAAKTAHNSTAANKSSHAEVNASLPDKEQRLFDRMEADFNASKKSLAAAEELIAEFKNQTALEIMYGQNAALAEATKLDALKQMDRLLNSSMRLEHTVVHGISAQARSLLPNRTAMAENYSSRAAEEAAKAARLAKVVKWAEGNYTVAIEAAFQARQQRDLISAKMEKSLDSSVLKELNLSRLVKVINNTYYLNLTGENIIEVRLRGNLSEVNLTEVVKTDIERYYPSATKTSTKTPYSYTFEEEAPFNDSWPSIHVEIVPEKVENTKEHKHHKSHDDKPNILPSTAIIIVLVVLLAIALTGMAVLRAR